MGRKIIQLHHQGEFRHRHYIKPRIHKLYKSLHPGKWTKYLCQEHRIPMQALALSRNISVAITQYSIYSGYPSGQPQSQTHPKCRSGKENSSTHPLPSHSQGDMEECSTHPLPSHSQGDMKACMGGLAIHCENIVLYILTIHWGLRITDNTTKFLLTT